MEASMAKLQIIIGSTRPTRAADLVAPWVISRAREHGAFEVEVLDLRDWPLPMFGEHWGTIGDIADPTYSEPIVRAWNAKIKEADAFLIITPEYNHSIPGVLKNALDSVFVSFGMRDTVVIPNVVSAFSEERPINPVTEAALRIVLDDLEWWSSALGTARTQGELAPGTFRMRAAIEAAASASA